MRQRTVSLRYVAGVFYVLFLLANDALFENNVTFLCVHEQKKKSHTFFSKKHASKTCPLSHVCTLARRSWQLATRSLFSIVRRAGLFFCFRLSLFSPHVAFCGHSDTLMAAKCSLGILLESFFFSYLCAACSPSICGFCYSDIGVLSQPFATHPDSSVCHPFVRIRNAENLSLSANSAPVIESLGKAER